MSYSTSGTISEVLIGTGVLYIKDASTTSLVFPGDDSSNFKNPTTMTPAWEQVGYSEDGWTLEVDKTFEDVMVAEELDPIKTLKSDKKFRLTGELAQASLTNFSFAMGGGSTVPVKSELVLVVQQVQQPLDTTPLNHLHQIPSPSMH